jgi:predicted dehydrogenase/nucleoside-diphosphate-sugar epimerase
MASTTRSLMPTSSKEHPVKTSRAVERELSGQPRRVALVGAGRIADTHAEALKGLSGVVLAAVIDPELARAKQLARKFGAEGAYRSLDEALAAGPLHAAHVLVPPPLHRSVAEQCLAAGLDTLVEKPMAETDADCAALQTAAQASGAALHVNQNFVHHPTQVELKRIVDDGTLGRLRHVACQFAMPLGQLQGRQFGHWMFREPRNLLLEQAVHPLSQIDDLVGQVIDVSVAVPPPRVIDGLPLQTGWMISMRCERGTAELYVALGHSFPTWTITALFDDGTATADYVNNRLVSDRPGPWIDFYDSFSKGRSASGQLRRAGRRNLFDYLLSTAKLKPRSDAFFQSMRGSIKAFYAMLDTGEGPAMDGAQGRRLTALCSTIAARAGLADPPARPLANAASGSYDVLVIGGTGFLGRPIVAALVGQGQRVAVLARNTANLPPLFQHNQVGVVRGDVTNPDDLERAMAGVSAVVNLAHAGGAADWDDIRDRIVGGAEMVAQACLRAKVRHLIHTSTIAALYLGSGNDVVTGATPPDPNSERRAQYSRAKAMAEQALTRLRATEGLPLTILRPGVVIGEGGPPFHSGIGLYNREQHCLGWNRGDNPLPLVLAEDVASAVALCLAKPVSIGRDYNVIGDVRLSAADYTAELGRALGRPLRYRGQSLAKQQAIELFKWTVKRATGRREQVPSMADLRSRGMVARFDTSDIKGDLGWAPEADREAFIRKAFHVHATD